MTKIRWMTDLPDRCPHPPENLIFREGLMGDYVECLRCGAHLEREWVRARQKELEKLAGQSTLEGPYRGPFQGV